MISLARPYLGRLIGAGLLAAATELAGLALMATAIWMLVTAAGQPPLHTLTVAIVAVRALAIGRGVLRYTERLAGHDAVLRMLTEVRARVFASLASAKVPVARSGDSLSQLVSDVDAVQDLMLRVLVPGAAASLVAVLAIAGAAVVAPLAGLVLAAGLALGGVALPLLAVFLTRGFADQLAPLRGALAADAVDLTHGAADLAAFGATPAAVAAATRRVNLLAAAERRLALLGGALDAAGVLVSGVTTAGVVAAALHAGVSGVMVGVLAVGTLAAMESALALVAAARRWAEIRVSLTRLAPHLSAPHAVCPAPVVPGPVALHGVSVTGRLSDVDLVIPPGHRVAVVGPSGAGKSTLAGVLAGLVDVSSGEARLGGRVTGLLAEAYVFHATVRENLLLGRPSADESALASACAAAGLLDWVREQPSGWDTVVGEDGAQLSGGQRQRLALARALLAGSADTEPGGRTVLVLDEPTEGLDPAAADAVLESVLAYAQGSVVLVTHRLRGLSSFDEILVLDAGRVVQRGRHDDLVAVPGWYRDRWLSQELAERGYLSLAP
jgi:ATP-binding cassette, subfamily C, bacterial CydC